MSRAALLVCLLLAVAAGIAGGDALFGAVAR